jgi:hypothetical protein
MIIKILLLQLLPSQELDFVACHTSQVSSDSQHNQVRWLYTCLKNDSMIVCG